jgi:sterol desaturase/sphingolipid hydroxylase (fatty acid hydroxylase superfamily)
MELWSAWIRILGFDFSRYAIPTLFAFGVFWVWGRERFRGRLVFGRYAPARRLWHDIGWSMSTVLIFSGVGLLSWYGGRVGILQRYEPIDRYGWPWFVGSILVVIVLQDAWFYWTHRLMHHPKLFRRIHRIHHRSTDTSPFTAYAFSPLEALVHAIFVPLVWLLVPVHEIAMFLFLLFMITRNVLGHLAIELFPSGFTASWLGRLSTTTTHHALHHRRPSSNFGLYFTCWDRLAGTEDRDYQATFDRVTQSPAKSTTTTALGGPSATN